MNRMASFQVFQWRKGQMPDPCLDLTGKIHFRVLPRLQSQNRLGWWDKKHISFLKTMFVKLTRDFRPQHYFHLLWIPVFVMYSSLASQDECIKCVYRMKINTAREGRDYCVNWVKLQRKRSKSANKYLHS